MDFRWQSTMSRWFQSQPQRVVIALATVLAVALCSLVAYDLQRAYTQEVMAVESKIGGLTQLLQEHARQSMRRVEVALSLAAQEVEAEVASKGKITPATGTHLRAFLPQDGLIASFAVINTQGQTVASTLTEISAELPDAHDRDFVLAHQQTDASVLVVGQATRSRISGLWIIPVSIKLQDGALGYLMAGVQPEYFQRLYQSIDTGDDGFVTLFTTQGWAVARWPFNSEIAERNWLNAPMFQREIPKSSQAVLRQKIAATGVESMYGYRVLADYPLVVALGLSLEEVLLPWRERVLYETAGLLLVLLFLGGAATVLLRQLRARKQAESALRLSEISLHTSSQPTLWIGRDARILRVNPAACALHGYAQEDMRKMTLPDLNPQMGMEKWPAHWERLRQARHMRFETVHRNSEGEDIPVDVELNYFEFDGQEYNFTFVRDLRVRKQAEAEIQRSVALLRSAIDAVDEAFVLFDAQDRLVYCNAKYNELYPALQDVLVPGARFEDLIRIGAQRGMYRESLGREDEWVAQRLQAHRTGTETRVQHRADGRVLRVIDRRTPEGCIAGIRVDITEMVQATEDAQQASRYKSQFLANMSHEIRTPMNAILGLLTLLQGTPLSSAQNDYVNKTLGAAQSLLHLLNDILDFSKVEAGKMELDLQPLRLDRMLRDIAVILSSNMAGKGIELLFDVDSATPQAVVADALRLQQVLLNLGGNAIKFTERGQVVLRLRNRSSAEQLARREAQLEFCIEDTGIGIAPDKLEHIFSGFSQAEASTTRRFGGSGLGLAISKRLVELMGGKLEVHSTPGVGSRFNFSLCLPLAELGLALAEPQRTQATKRVLVVDDNPAALGIVAAMTRSWSWPTEVADSGAQALALIQSRGSGMAEFPFDVIYLDAQMPGMDGWQTACQIRALCSAQQQQPRICMLSASPGDSLQARSTLDQALVDCMLFKPVTASDLYDAAREPLPSAMPLTPQQPLGRPLAGMRLLVVEDNPINQQVAQELLQAQGAQVALAANGQLGVDAIASARPPFDVVLMDIQMPELDGFGATRKIREELHMTALPIVAMTANAMASDRQECLAAGMNEHVGKPFDMTHLVEVLLQVSPRPTQAPVAPAPEPPAQEIHHDTLAGEGSNGMYSSPYLDLAPALDRISGLTALYVDIAQEYLRTLSAVEAEFRQAEASGPRSNLVAQMHSLKGTSSTLGAMALSSHAAGLEQLFKRSESPCEPLEHLPELIALVEHTRQAVLAAVQSLAVTEAASAAGAAGQGALTADEAAAQRRQARDCLAHMAQLLGASNLAVLDQFANRGHALDALSAEQLEPLQLALRGLDLELARQLCQRYIEALG